MASQLPVNYTPAGGVIGSYLNLTNGVANLLSAPSSFITSAGATTTLNVSSKSRQVVTGTMTQNFVLPNALATLTSGFTITIDNESTQSVTVTLNDGTTLLATIAAGSRVILAVSDVSTSNGVWNISTFPNVNIVNNATFTAVDNSGASLVFTSVSPNYSISGKGLTGSLTLTYPSTISSTAGASISGLPLNANSYGGGLGFASDGTIVVVQIQPGTSILSLTQLNGAVMPNNILAGLTLKLFFAYNTI